MNFATLKLKLYAACAAIGAFLLLLLDYVRRGAKIDRMEKDEAEATAKAHEAAYEGRLEGDLIVRKAEERASARSRNNV